MRDHIVIRPRNFLLGGAAIAALLAGVGLGVHAIDTRGNDPHLVPDKPTAGAPYQVPIPASAPSQALLPGQVLIPAQVLAPGEIVVPSQGVAYVAGQQAGQVFSQTYANVRIANVGGYAGPQPSAPPKEHSKPKPQVRVVERTRTVYVRDPNSVPVDQFGLTRGEEGAVIGGLVGAGAGALIDRHDRAAGAGLGGLAGAVGGGVIGHVTQPR